MLGRTNNFLSELHLTLRRELLLNVFLSLAANGLTYSNILGQKCSLEDKLKYIAQIYFHFSAIINFHFLQINSLSFWKAEMQEQKLFPAKHCGIRASVPICRFRCIPRGSVKKRDAESRQKSRE
ncbi:hypothetical protein AVEN_30839-1 [Araneus ventricosus]|uniref:Uncharacterized protein n=1 Tax=Araneus ventricosus TaxID=182803 RepID=A0A4Y2DFP6_ARAVE|nr:hypothetical protein AVEN_30839-1 [Araneus ventricosus]